MAIVVYSNTQYTMAASTEKKEGTKAEEDKTKGADKKLETEMPLSEKDEVKKAEHQTNKEAHKQK
ncbi:hypothetical protein [Mucilaginibacter conchicola]|uniref:hypothetical protein n=1 Tax=Mucilaginibacter conchicola TaxID=2303333 RepID=UPI00131407BA|nr:hypothetical protein [Mucilaginibacter conchicola]